MKSCVDSNIGRWLLIYHSTVWTVSQFNNEWLINISIFKRAKIHVNKKYLYSTHEHCSNGTFDVVCGLLIVFFSQNLSSFDNSMEKLRLKWFWFLDSLKRLFNYEFSYKCSIKIFNRNYIQIKEILSFNFGYLTTSYLSFWL